MTKLRRVLAPLTAIWLCSQVGAVVLVPGALWITAADARPAQCTCGHDDGGMCPMHERRAGGPMHHHQPMHGSPRCAMRPANSPDAAVLTTLVGTAGLVAEPPRALRPAVPSADLTAADTQLVGERPVPPDPPPPRV